MSWRVMDSVSQHTSIASRIGRYTVWIVLLLKRCSRLLTTNVRSYRLWGLMMSKSEASGTLIGR